MLPSRTRPIPTPTSQGNRGSEGSSDSPRAPGSAARRPRPQAAFPALRSGLCGPSGDSGVGGQEALPAGAPLQQSKGRRNPKAIPRDQEGSAAGDGEPGVGWGGGVGAGARAGEGHRRTSPGPGCLLPPRAGCALAGAGWEVGLGRPARGGALTAAREPGRGEQPGERAQPGRGRHLAGPDSASQPWVSRNRRPAWRPLAGGGAEASGAAAALRGDV